MTISSDTFRWAYTSTGGATYQYTNKILASGDLVVYVGGVQTTAFTVTGVGNAGGGNVVLTSAPSAGVTVLITKDGVEFTQETDYMANDAFPAESHEDALDKQTNIAIKIWDYVRRSIKVGITSSATDLEFPAGQASKLIGWDSTGLLIQNYSVTDLSAVTATGMGVSLVTSANATTIQNLLGLTMPSDFIKTVMDDTTSTQARQTLGLGNCAFSIYSTADVNIPASVYTKVSFAGTLFDAGNNVSNNRFTAPYPGKFLFNAGLSIHRLSDAVYTAYLAPYKNGTIYRAIQASMYDNAAMYNVPVTPVWSDVVSLAQNDYIEIYTYSNQAISVQGAAAGIYSYFSGVGL